VSDSARTARRLRIEAAFEEYVRLERRRGAPDITAFLQAQDPDGREELERMLEDYLDLKGDAGGRVRLTDLQEGRVVGDYRLLRRIGSGGMGVVWEAEQLSLRRRVALKILHPHFSLSGTAVERFHREAVAGGRLAHARIVAVHEVGEADGVHYISQQLIAGGRSLADSLAALRASQEFAPGYYRELAEFFVKLADALEVAHAAGVIHRDIKPGNILIADDGEPMLADFGLAKLTDELGLSRSGELAGTPYYMSPEQAASRRIGIDHRTDVFSLGATLYEGLTLARPFDGDTSQQVLHKILLEEPPEPQRLRSRVPLELSVICRKELEKQRDRRYQSMADFAADLRRFLRDEPILARPPGPVARGIKWSRRHPVVTAASAVGIVAIGVILGGLVRLARVTKEAQASEGRARESEAVAQAREQQAEASARQAVHAREEADAQRHEAVRRSARLSIAAAASALRDGNGELGLLELEKIPPEHRRWEWSVLAGRLDPSILTLRGHVADVLCARFGPDTSTIVSCSRDGEVKLWDVAARVERWSTRAHHGSASSVASDPRGEFLASVGADGMLKLWRPLDGSAIRELEPDMGPLTRVDVSFDGSRLAVAGAKGACVYDTRTWKVTARHAFDLGVAALAFHPQQPLLAMGSARTLSLLPPDAASSGATPDCGTVDVGVDAALFRGHWALLRAAVRVESSLPEDGVDMWLSVIRPDRTHGSSDGVKRASIRGDGWATYEASVWVDPDAERLAIIFRIFGGAIVHIDQIELFDLGSSGQTLPPPELQPSLSWRCELDAEREDWYLAPGTTAHVSGENPWAGTGSLRVQFSSPEVLWRTKDSVRDLTLSSDGSLMAVVGEAGHIGAWALPEGRKVLDFPASFWTLFAVAVSPDARIIATGGVDGDIDLWDARTSELIATISDRAPYLWSLSFDAEGKLLLGASSDHAIRIWSVSELTGSRLLVDDRPTGQVVMSGSGNTVAALVSLAGGRGTERFAANGAVFWNASRPAEVRELAEREASASVALDAKGERLASVVSNRAMGAGNQSVIVWNVAGSEPVVLVERTERVERAQVAMAAALSSDGSRLAFGGAGMGIRVLDVDSGVELAHLRKVSLRIRSLAFTTDSSVIAVGDSRGVVTLWSVDDGTRVLRLQAHPRFVDAMQFSDDDRLLATLGQDESRRELSLWHSDTGARIELSPAPVSALGGNLPFAFLDEGRRLAWACHNVVQLFDTATGEMILSLETQRHRRIMGLGTIHDGVLRTIASDWSIVDFSPSAGEGVMETMRWVAPARSFVELFLQGPLGPRFFTSKLRASLEFCFDAFTLVLQVIHELRDGVTTEAEQTPPTRER
jgi:WD40 repeat protein